MVPLVSGAAGHSCSADARCVSSPVRCGVLRPLADSSALAGLPVLLVAHQGPVVAQKVHGVLPVPAGATVVLKAGLRRTQVVVSLVCALW